MAHGNTGRIGARSTAFASTLWFNSSTRADAFRKPVGCGATVFNDLAAGSLDLEVSWPTLPLSLGQNTRCLSAYAY